MPPLERTGLTPLFAVPFLSHVWEDAAGLNAALAPLILERERTAPGRAKSNVGGWQSAEDFAQWAGEPGRQLLQRTFDAANHATQQLFRAHGHREEFRWNFSVWANVNRRGQYNTLHLHPGATWSSVYYVDAGEAAPEQPQSGAISFVNPLLAAAHGFFPRMSPPQLTVNPVAGQTLLFPSYLQHFVHPYWGGRPRISVAINLIKDPSP